MPPPFFALTIRGVRERLFFFAIVFGTMLVEARRASSNERAQRARGGVEPAGDQRAKDVRAVTERSNVVVLPFPSDGGAYYPFRSKF